MYNMQLQFIKSFADSVIGVYNKKGATKSTENLPWLTLTLTIDSVMTT